MKSLEIFVIVFIVALFSLNISAKAASSDHKRYSNTSSIGNNNVLNLLKKLKKSDRSKANMYMPTAVAGVRGSDVVNNDKAELRRSLYW